MTNVLITSVGRRSYLVEWFERAVGTNGNVVVTNSDDKSTGFSVAKIKYVTPLVNDHTYIQHILQICEKHDIHLIVPLLDEDVLSLSQCREIFDHHEITLLSPTYEHATICCDKLKTYHWMIENDIPTIHTEGFDKNILNTETLENVFLNAEVFDENNFIKPRWGTASKYMHSKDRSRIKQKRIKGDEYCLIILNDLNGNYVSTFPIKSLEKRSGETDKGITVDNPELTKIGKLIGECLSHRGPMDVDVMFMEDRPAVLDINPRFGGGYPFAHMAGVDIPSSLIAMINEKSYEEFLHMKTNVSHAKGICFFEM